MILFVRVKVPPILNFPDTAKTAYGNWYDAAGFQSSILLLFDFNFFSFCLFPESVRGWVTTKPGKTYGANA